MIMNIYSPIKWSYRVTQKFGVNPSSYKKYWLNGHNWIDLAFPIAGTKWPLYSPVKWKVTVRTDDKVWYWKYIRIETDPELDWSSLEITMAHLDSFNVKVWDRVTPASKIWIMWTTWNSTWVHLHLWVRIKKKWVVQNYYNWYKWSVDFGIKEYEGRMVNIPK